MIIAKVMTLSAAAAFIGLLVAAPSANAQCYGYECNWPGQRSFYRTPGAYGYAVAPHQAQSQFPNVVLYGDAPNLYMYGYALGYRDAYGCLWLDRHCPKG